MKRRNIIWKISFASFFQHLHAQVSHVAKNVSNRVEDVESCINETVL